MTSHYSGRLAYRAVLIAAILLGASVARGEICAPEPQGNGRVAAIIDTRTVRLDDGREVRLAAIETRGSDTTALTRLALGRTVSLHGQSDAPDRYGRQVAWLFAEGAPRSLQADLVADGAAITGGGALDPACRSELLAAEAQARQSQRALWRNASVIKTRKVRAIIGPIRGNSAL